MHKGVNLKEEVQPFTVFARIIALAAKALLLFAKLLVYVFRRPALPPLQTCGFVAVHS